MPVVRRLRALQVVETGDVVGILARARRQQRHGQRESGAASDVRVEGHLVAQQVGGALHDGKTESEAAGPRPGRRDTAERSEEHTSELQSLMRTSYAVFCLKK